MRIVQIEGRRFGRLIVLGHAGSRYWLVRCDCGTEKKVRSNHLTCGLTRSCGCLARESAAARVPTAHAASVGARRRSAETRVQDGKKNCTRRDCTQGNPQPLSEFPQNTTKSLDGRASWCRTCRQDAHLRNSFGITLARKCEMIIAQDGRCANRGCGVALVIDGPGRNAHLDHDHVSGEMRGVLCRDCNLALGYLQDSPEMITGLLRYAERYSQPALRTLQGRP